MNYLKKNSINFRGVRHPTNLFISAGVYTNRLLPFALFRIGVLWVCTYGVTCYLLYVWRYGYRAKCADREGPQFYYFSLFYYFRFLCFRFPILLFPVPWLPGYLHLFSVWFICLLRDFLFIPVYLSHYFNLAVYMPYFTLVYFFLFNRLFFSIFMIVCLFYAFILLNTVIYF